jgi:hypothetical protein
MFSGCKKLNYIKVEFTDWNSDDHSTSFWVNSIADVGTFVCPSALVYNDEGTYDPSFGTSYIPKGWTVETE